MSVLILKNIGSEGPGTIEDFLVANAVPFKVVDLASGGVPAGGGFETLLMMGGPMSVNDEHEFPFLAEEIKLAEDFMRRGKKVFGVCLGAQIMAKALGAKVYPGPEKEIGWYDIELVDGGLRDALMNKLAFHPREGDFREKFKVFHWHGETFDIPVGAERLAKSALYPNQAFRFGKNAYAFQFHIEVGKEMICDWLKNERVDIERVRKDTELFFDDYRERAMNFYKAFFQ